jgi:2-iminobutanoate/2-iminopropanoate deaminase
MSIRRITVDSLARLPAFCHAVVTDGWIHVSGTLGTQPSLMELVPGRTGAETTQAVRNIEQILHACGATLADLVKVNVYLAVIGTDPPARITVGRAALALGARVEIDAVAYQPSPRGDAA